MVAAVTQPDRPAGRGQHERVSPVKAMALEHGVPVLQPVRLRDAGWAERLAEHGADVAVVVAFGQILPRAILDVPARGSINVHASLLPRYRGAAPIAWAIMRGERERGSPHSSGSGMDTGPMLLQRATPIGAEETAGELAGRLAAVGADVLLETLDRLDTLTRARRTPESRRSRRVSGRRTACSTGRSRPRAWPPVPGTEPVARRDNARAGRAAPDLARAGRPRPRGAGRPPRPAKAGSPSGRAPISSSPLEVQPENRRPMAWEAYLRGARLAPGALLGATVPGA